MTGRGKRFLIVVLFLFVLAGCGGPKFVVKYRYVPPENHNAQNCLKSCEEKFNKCQMNCKKFYNECLKEAYNNAIKLYQELLKSYNVELKAYAEECRVYSEELSSWNDRYRKIYRDYLFFKKVCNKDHDKYACRRKKDLEKELNAMEREKPERPVRPVKPDLDRLVNRLSLKCLNNCGCQRIYDNCFVSCGGKLYPEKFCVENCK